MALQSGAGPSTVSGRSIESKPGEAIGGRRSREEIDSDRIHERLKKKRRPM
jgi:hypothetical protein